MIKATGVAWSVRVAPNRKVTTHDMLANFIGAGYVWSWLTAAQRRVMVAAVDGPVSGVRRDVLRRLVDRGLIEAGSVESGSACLSDAGRAVMRCRP